MLPTLMAALCVWAHFALACPDPLSRMAESTNGTNQSTGRHRRLFSLNRIDNPPAGYQKWLGPWPWNDNCQKYQVTYCFENQQTHDEMWDVWKGAVARWGPAMLGNSDLEITWDPSCTDVHCICQVEGVRHPDTLVIKLSGPGEPFHATLGYGYGTDKPGRHDLYGNSFAWDQSITQVEQQEEASVSLAHELGHVFGLEHEHQRPDAYTELTINCQAVRGYSEARAKAVVSLDPAFAPQESADNRMTKVCTRPELAATIFPNLLHLMPYKDHYQPGYWGPTFYTPVSHGALFDHQSIMMYSSATYARAFNPDDRSTWTLSHIYDRYPDWGPRLKHIVVRGGTTNPKYQSISEGDARRIKLLYPQGGPPKGSHKRNDGSTTENATVSAIPMRNITVGNRTVGHWAPVKFVSAQSESQHHRYTDPIRSFQGSSRQQ